MWVLITSFDNLFGPKMLQKKLIAKKPDYAMIKKSLDLTGLKLVKVLRIFFFRPTESTNLL